MNAPAVAVLGYHKIGTAPAGCDATWFYIPEEAFEAHLNVVRQEGWRIIDLDTFLRGLDAPETLPDRATLITFDDGCRSLTDGALRILTDLGLPAVVFVPSEYLGRTNSFDAGMEPEERICDWNDLRRLENAGVSVQSHSASHPRLSELDRASQERELLSSKATLETGLGRRVTAFAYPFGDSGADVATMDRLMRSAGYEAAFLYGGGVVQPRFADRFQLPRIAMGPDTDLVAELRAAGASRP